MTSTKTSENYTHIPAIRWLIRTLRNNNAELDGIAIWNAILSLQFPPTEGFFVRPHIHAAWRGYKSWFELRLSHLQNGHQNPVLVLYYQGADRSNDDQWEDAQNELQRYLVLRYGYFAEDAPPVYGILAIGVKLKIFKYDSCACCIERFVPPWDLERHAGLVCEMLANISQGHTGGEGCEREGVNGAGGQGKMIEEGKGGLKDSLGI